MITRRAALTGALALGLPAGLARAADRATPEALIEAARARGARPYAPERRVLVAPFEGLDYDSYRGISPVAGKAAALPVGGVFRADLLPPGWLFADPVEVRLPGHELRFAHDLFTHDPALVDLPARLPDPEGMGFSGMRLLAPLNRPDHWDEVLVLQGASYFRALAQGTVHGLSARGLALGTGGPAPEEFPVTREIHVFEADTRVTLGCLIDSPRAAAALIATLTPGATTRMSCALHLFPREVLADAGIAPLTSMFQHNALGPARIDDFRPAVHDSDVLVIDNGGGERLWRPLANPARVQMSSFLDAHPRGFGLLQSPAGFEAFHDAEAAYHRRPSAWVRPSGDWGKGAVMLLEIPTRDEFADNIVAFWRPEAPLGPGAHRFDYELDWLPPGAGALPVAAYPLAPVRAASGVEPNAREGRLFVLDFAQRETVAIGAIRPEIVATGGVRIEGVAVYPLRGVAADTLRLSFVLTPEAGAESAELRVSLPGERGQALAPVWLYRWTRAEGGGV